MSETIITYIIAGFIQLGFVVLPTATTCVVSPVELDLSSIQADFECSVVAGTMAFRVVGTVYNLEIGLDNKDRPDFASY